MAYLIDIVALLLALIITFLLYKFYYKIFIIKYVKKIKITIQNGELKKAKKMKEIALKKQPKRMNILFRKYGVI